VGGSGGSYCGGVGAGIIVVILLILLLLVRLTPQGLHSAFPEWQLYIGMRHLPDLESHLTFGVWIPAFRFGFTRAPNGQVSVAGQPS